MRVWFKHFCIRREKLLARRRETDMEDKRSYAGLYVTMIIK